jgi:hypothetical protein
MSRVFLRDVGFAVGSISPGDKEAGGKLKDCKERGEWAELYFMMMAVGLGMKVLRLFGETGRYDVGVENGSRVVRVQVKSTIYKRRNGEYSLNVMGPHWYIIPFEVMGRTNSSLHFTPTSKRQKYGEYWEAWDLLREEGLTIQACVDEGVDEGDCEESGFLTPVGMAEFSSSTEVSWPIR